MKKLLLIALLIVGCVFALDSTSVSKQNKFTGGILYLKDGTSLDCIDILSVRAFVGFDGFDYRKGSGFFYDVICDNKIIEIELVDKMVFSDGRITTGNELVAKKYWAYTITTSIIVLLVIITI